MTTSTSPMPRTLRVVLTTASGVEYDLTDRVIDGGLELQSTAEESLAEFRHGELTATLDDGDGLLTELFDGIAPGEEWDLVVERSTGRRRPLFERVFGGVLDPVRSITFDRKDETVEIAAYAYSKLMEDAAGENVRRSVTGRTASVSAASKTVTVSDTTDLEPGDEITLEDGTNSETQTIASVDSSTQVTTVDAFANAFTSADLTLETPFWRNETMDTLAGYLFDEADIGATDIDSVPDLGGNPFVVPFVTSGLTTATPAGLLEKSNEIYVYAASKRYSAPDLVSGFTDDGADTAKIDWRPYTTSEPGSLYAANGADDGTRAQNYSTGDYYELAVSGSDLQLKKNGVLIATVYTLLTGQHFDTYGVDVQQGWGEIVVGYRWIRTETLIGNPLSPTDYSYGGSVQRYNSSGSSLGALITAAPGLPRSLAAQSALVVHLLPFGNVPLDPADNQTRIYKHDGSNPYLWKTLDGAFGLDVWTFRDVGDFWVCLATADTSSAKKVVAWDQSTLGVVLNEIVNSSPVGSRVLGTMFSRGGVDADVYVAYAAGVWFAVTTTPTGVVPYADFDGQSCAASLRDLVVALGMYFEVDEHRVGRVKQRPLLMSSWETDREIDQPLDQQIEQVWEFYAPSVMVSGETESGESFEAIAGDTGDSADRVEIESQVVTTQSFASSVAQTYNTLFGQVLKQYVEEQEDEGDLLRFMDRVERDGERYVVLSVEVDLVEQVREVEMVRLG